MKLYAGFIQAQKSGIAGITAIAVTASSKEEAVGKAYGMLKSTYPQSDGWCNIFADVVEIPDKVIAEVMNGK